jgi:hypothetical protein
MLSQTIKNEMNAARKSGDKNKVIKLGTLLGDIQKSESTQGKPLDDSAVVKIVKKFIAGVEETIGILKVKETQKEFEHESSEIMESIFDLMSEVRIYSQFLPSEMSLENLESLISEIVNEICPEKKASDMGKVMKALKEKTQKSGDNYDGKIASEIVKRKLS